MRLFNKFNTLVLTVFSVLSINALYAGHDEVDGYVENDFNIGGIILNGGNITYQDLRSEISRRQLPFSAFCFDCVAQFKE